MRLLGRLVVVFTAGAAPWQGVRAAPLDDVLAADRAFAAAARKDGARAAFVAFAAPDAIMFRAGVGPVKGHAAIGQAFEGATALPEWEPEAGEIAASGELAYTWGYFRWTPADGAGKPLTGSYVSIWRRVGGQWKWVIDLGVPGPPKSR